MKRGARKRWLLAVCLLGPLLPGAGVPERASAAQVSTILQTQHWSLDRPAGDGGLSQTLLAAAFRLPLGDRPLNLRGYVPLAWTRDETSDGELSALGDAQLRLIWRDPRSRWSVTAGIDLPTGKTALTLEEYRIASRILASRVLDLRLKRPGEGLDLMTAVTRSVALGRNTVLGLALAGFLKGTYDILEETDGAHLEAQPGHRLHASLSLIAREHEEDPAWDLQTVLGLQLAGKATLQEEERHVDVEEGVQATLEAVYGRRLRLEDHLTASLFLLARDRSRLDTGRLEVEEALGLATRWITEVGLAYARPIATLGTWELGLAHALYRIDPTHAANSRVTRLSLRTRQSLAARVSGELQVGYGFGRTPWAEPEEPEAWEQRDLTGWILGLRAVVDL